MQKDEGPLSKFHQIMADSVTGRQFLSSLKRLRDATIFAPNNAAWEDDNLRNILANENKLHEVLNMHLVKDQRLSVERIKQNNQNQVGSYHVH